MKWNVEAKKPFYVAYWPQLTPFTGLGKGLQETLARFDVYVGELMQELKTLDIEANTWSF